MVVRYLVALLVFLLVVSCANVQQGNDKLIVSDVIEQGLINTLEVGDENYSSAYKQNRSVYELMVDLQMSDGLEFEATDYGPSLGYFVQSISGRRGDDEYWSFYVNGDLAKVGVSSYVLDPGDKVEWRLESAVF
jgi:hypothetical protein